MQLTHTQNIFVAGLLTGCVITSVFTMWVSGEYRNSRDRAVMQAVMDFQGQDVELLDPPPAL
jgi:hypothetical protein